MDKNSILGFVLIAAIFVTWGILSKPDQEELDRIKRENDSIALVRQQQELERQIQETKKKENLSEQQKINDSLKVELKKAELGAFSGAMEGENSFYTLENEKIKFVASAKGGRPYSVTLKEYKTHDGKPLVLFDGDSTEFGLSFFHENRPIGTNELFFTPTDSIKHKIVYSGAQKLGLRLNIDDGKYIEYTYSLKPESYQVDVHVTLSGLQDISSASPRTIDLDWAYYSIANEKGWKNESFYTTIYYKPKDEKVDDFNARTNKSHIPEDIFTPVEWIGYKDQFFSTVLIADNNFDNAFVEMFTMPEDSEHIRQFKSKIGLIYNHSPMETMKMSFYFGPNRYKYLKNNYGHLELQDLVTVGGGIIKFINQAIIINIFEWLNNSIANYGIIILLLTFIIKMFLLPLTWKSYISQAKMRVLKPLVDEATEKIPKDKAMERQQATMGIYKKAGVSPMGGCLPMVLQMPILFAMFRFFPSSIELRQQGFLWASDLSTYDAIIEWDKNLGIITEHFGNHISLFTVLMTVTTILSMKMNGSAAQSNQMPGMKGMMYIMPVMMMVFLNKFPAGLTYYYFLANVITLGQNLLFKQFINEEELLKKLKSKNNKPKKKTGWQKRLEDLQKQQHTQQRKRK